MRGLLAVAVVALVVAAAAPMALPVAEQLPLFLKILSYDKDLAVDDDRFTIGVVHQSRQRASVRVRDELTGVLDEAGFTLLDRPVEAVGLDLDAEADLAALLDRQPVDVLYITPLRAYDVRALTAVSRARDLTTLTGVPEYVDEGVAVGLGVRRGRPLIRVHLDAARAEGARFHSQLLRLAEVIR